MSGTPATSIEQIDAWRGCASETQHLEFKEAHTQFEMAKLREYCVALANEGGGHLLLGIADKPPRPVVGTHAFRNVVMTAERLYDGLGFRVEVEEVAHPAGRVLVFHIPPRPRGTAYHLNGRYLMRCSESLVPMSEDRLRSVFSEGRPHWLLHAARHALSAEDVVRDLDTAKYFQLLKLPHPESQNAVLDRLARENFILHEPPGYAITNLGAILLARHLEPFDGIRRKGPRVISYSGKSKVHTNRELATVGGYAATFEDLIDTVELQTPVREVIERALRRDERMYPLIAIRELIANALIHQDLDVSGATVMVEIYTDRIEISNPGLPGVQPERFIDEYRCRNEPLADLMRRFGICEEKGSGIDKWCRPWKSSTCRRQSSASTACERSACCTELVRSRR